GWRRSMSTGRREFLNCVGGLAAAGFVLGAGTSTRAGAAERVAGPIGGVAFDAFTLLDFRTLPATAERLFPGQGARFEEVWRTRLFDYSWLRVLGGHYSDFEAGGARALRFAPPAPKPSPSPAAPPPP